MKLQEILKNEPPFIIQSEVGFGLRENIKEAMKIAINKNIVFINSSEIDVLGLQQTLDIDISNSNFYIFEEINKASISVIEYIINVIYNDFIGLSSDVDFKLGIPIYKYDVDDIFNAEFSDIFKPEFANMCEKYFGGNSNQISGIVETNKFDEPIVKIDESTTVIDIPLSDVDAEDILGYPYIIKNNIFNNGVYGKKMLQQIRDGLKYIKENELTFTLDGYLSPNFTNFLYFEEPTGILKKFTCEQGLFLREKGIELISKALKEKLEDYIKTAQLECEKIGERSIDYSKQFFKQQVRVLRSNMHKNIEEINDDIEGRKRVINRNYMNNISLIDNYYTQLDVEA